MGQYSIILCSNVMRDRLEVEIQKNRRDGRPREVALVYKTSGGWGIDYADDAFANARDAEFDAVVARARELLQEYKDRNDEEPPEGLTAAGMSAWLMEENGDAEE